MASEHLLLHRYCEGGGVFNKAMAAYQHTIGKTSKYLKEAGVGTELVIMGSR